MITIGLFDCAYRARARVVYFGSWANKPAASAVALGDLAWITDIGGLSCWFSDGTDWYPRSGVVAIGSHGAEVSLGASPGSTDSVLWQVLLPGGVIVPGKTMMRVQLSAEKTGGNSDTFNVRFRIGTAGSTSDATTGLGLAVGTTNSSAAILNQVVFPSATTYRRSAAAGVQGPAAWSATSTTARPAAGAIPNVSNPLYFSITGQMVTGTTETGSIDGVSLQLFMRP